MSEKNLRNRLALPLAIAAFSLIATAPRAEADGGSKRSHHSGHRGSSFSISVGHHGHFGYGYSRYGHGRYGHSRYGHSRYRYSPYRYRHYSPYRHHYYPYYYGHGYGNYYPASYGRLDINVKPKKTTQVFIDGKYVGLAGSFDGWPDHLWLDRESYEVILYNPGYETIVRHVEVQPGIKIDINEVMQPGESTPVEKLSTAVPKEKRQSPQRTTNRPPVRYPTADRQTAPPVARDLSQPAGPDVMDARSEPPRVTLSITPTDASVYLDGHFLGVASEINERRTGILIDPGTHVLEVVRPGYTSREIEFEAESGKKIDLDVGLANKGPKKAGSSA